MPDLLARVSRAASRGALYLAAGGLTLMTVIIIWQVFARYVLQASPSWTEQLALFLMLWFILFAAAAGVREGFHIRLSLVQELAPPRVSKILQLLSHLVVLLFGAAMVRYGIEYVVFTWAHTIPTLGLPRGLSYLPIPLSGALVVLFAAEHILAEARGETVKPLWS